MTESNFNLEINKYLSDCNTKDVISLKSTSLFYVHEFCNLVLSSLDRGWNNSVEAEVLEPESGKWRTGKMRMRVILEFCPDEPE